MELTADNIEELIAILEANPALRKRVVEALLDEEWARVQASADRAFEAIRLLGDEVRAFRASTEARLTALEIKFDDLNNLLVVTDARAARHEEHLVSIDAKLESIDGRLVEHDARFDHLEGRFDRLENRFDHVEDRLDRLDGRVGNLEGWRFADQYVSRVKSRLGPYYRRVRPLDPVDLPGLEDAHDSGKVDHDAWTDLLRVDLSAVADRRSPEARDVVVLAELSLTVDIDDVRRVHRRAEALRRAGFAVDALVDGERILDDAATEAAALGVLVLSARATAGRSFGA